MYSLALTFHLLGAVVWVGGMFFAHMVLRPSLQERLDPPLRLQLMRRILDRFFPWVWAAIVLILSGGYWILLVSMAGNGAGYIHLMQGIGLLMIALFTYVWLGPYRDLARGIDGNSIPDAARALATIRRVIALNLVLGLAELILGATRPF